MLKKVSKSAKDNKDSNSKTKVLSSNRNVSWAEVTMASSTKKRLRSTPFPNSNKRRKITNSTPMALTFDESTSEDETSSSRISSKQFCDSPTFSNENSFIKKRGSRTSSVDSWKISSCEKGKKSRKNKFGWMETDLLLQPESNLSDSQDAKAQIFNFDQDKKLTNKIFKKLKKVKKTVTHSDNDSESDDDVFHNLTNNGKSDSKTYIISNCKAKFLDTDSADSESSVDDCFKYVKLNKDSCKIIHLPGFIEKDKKKIEKKNKRKVCKLTPSTENKESSANLDNTFDESENVSYEENAVSTENEEYSSYNEQGLGNQDAHETVISDSFFNCVRYRIIDDVVILILKPSIKLYFKGKLAVSVLSGAIEVLGYELSHENYNFIDIYCPRGSSYLCIETLGAKPNKNLKDSLRKFNMNNDEIENLCSDWNEIDTVVAAKNINNQMVEYLNKHVAQHLFPRIDSVQTRPLNEVENKLQCSFEIPSESCMLYTKHEEWDLIAHEILHFNPEAGSRNILCGGKGVGKSVLLRYLINRLLNDVEKVVCIDLDMGQSEFAVPGCVSVTIVDKPIFGPNYTHLKKPVKSFFVGDVNVMNCVKRYMDCVTALANFCEEHMDRSVPWIVNTMGFTNSLGPEIMTSVIKLLRPTLVVQIESKKRNRNYPSRLYKDFVVNYQGVIDLRRNVDFEYELKIINSVAQELVTGQWRAEPRFLRENCILSYFSQMLSESSDDILAIAPYVTYLPSIKLKHTDYKGTNLAAVINGNMVALCEYDDKGDIPECYGFGFVRGIDLLSQELYLLTPLDEEEMCKVKCLYMGRISLPPSVYMTSGNHEGLVPYVSLGLREGTSATPKRFYISAQKLLLQKKN